MKKHNNFNFSKTVESIHGFDKTVELIYESLKRNGFGVLFEIDVKKTMKDKIGADMERYVILGACSPHEAKSVIDMDKRIGTLLPCNIAVYEDNGRVFVSTVLPTALFPGEDANKIASGVEKRLLSVIMTASQQSG